MPEITLTLFSSSILMPLPETKGFGSIAPIKTFFIPVAAILFAHDPVLP